MTPAIDRSPLRDGSVVLVTGGSAGIGRASAVAFAEAGMRVVIAARDRERGGEVAQEIRERGGTASFIRCDVTSADEVSALFSQALDSYGRIDFAFNNAGVPGDGLLAELAPDDFDRTFAVNTRGLWLCLREELRLMSAQGYGNIVNNTSVHGIRVVFPGIGAYVASKHAAIALTRVAAMEYAGKGIRVNAIAPGPIESDMLAASEVAMGGATKWRGLIPTGEIGTPRQVADVVLWLFSSASSYVNGQVIGVDGGFLAT